jgi:hypothetical protein
MMKADKGSSKVKINFKPVFTHEQLYKTEEAFQHQNLGISRRVSLAVLTQSKGKLLKSLKDDFYSHPEDSEDALLFSMLEQVKQFREYSEVMLRYAQAAEARLLIIGQELSDCLKWGAK